MNEERTGKRLDTFLKGCWNLFCVIAIFLVIFFVLGQLFMPDERDVFESDCNMYDGQWYQVFDNGDRVPAEMPGEVKAERGEVVRIMTILPQNIYHGECLCFRSVWQDVEVYIDGELRAEYNTEDSRMFGVNSAFRYIFVEISEEDAGKELVYCFSSKSKYAGVTRPVRVGERNAIIISLVKEAGVRTILALFLLLVCAFVMIACVILKLVYKKNLPLRYLAWAIFLCALWMLSEIEFRQILFRNVSVLTNYTYWTLMLIAIPLVSYVNEIQGRRYSKIYAVSLAYSVVVFFLGTLLQIFDIMQFVNQLLFIHFGTLFALVSVISTITRDVIKGCIKEYIAIGIGVYGLLFTAVVEILLYYMKTDVSLGTFLALGLWFLLVMAIIKTAQDLSHSETIKQKAIMAKEAQSKFLANMSHEIRTPINAVIGMNEMILREAESDSVREYSYNIQSASNMLLGLVNEVLDFSKIESGQLELVENTYDVASLFKDGTLILNTRAGGKPISTKVNIDANIPSKLYGDELRIKQVLTNIISNAVKYTSEGSVTLKAFFRWMDDNTIALCFSVTDTGRGIKKEDLDRLFDSFKRLEIDKNRNIEGTGLGLSIVKHLVDLMSGTIVVDSEYGTGSVFTVSIPQKVVDKHPVGDFEESLKKTRKMRDMNTKTFTAPEAKVLVVDDNAMNLSLMRGLLKRTKIQVDVVSSGKECLKITKNNVYNIILMDHMMPEMDGIETLNLLREDLGNPNKDAIVIALTANAIAGCREMYLGFGFNDYVSKPIQAERLDTLLIEHLPEKLVILEGNDTKINSGEWPIELLDIARDTGLSYCMNSEELYGEMLTAFCEQIEEYKPQLELHYQNADWEQYAIIAHAIKGNSLNIGACEFSNLSKQHEFAGKEKNEDFIRREYSVYLEVLDCLVKKIKKM